MEMRNEQGNKKYYSGLGRAKRANTIATAVQQQQQQQQQHQQ